MAPILLVASGVVAAQLISPMPNGILFGYYAGGTDVALADGGTNASLTADNGAIVYSTASALALLAHTTTAGLPLLAGNAAAPTWGGNAVNNGNLSFNSTSTLAPSGTTQTVNWGLGNIQYLDMSSPGVSGNLTVTLSGATNNSQGLTLYVKGDASHTITFTGAKYPGGVAPVQTLSGTDVWQFDYINSTYYGYHEADLK